MCKENKTEPAIFDFNVMYDRLTSKTSRKAADTLFVVTSEQLRDTYNSNSTKIPVDKPIDDE